MSRIAIVLIISLCVASNANFFDKIETLIEEKVGVSKAPVHVQNFHEFVSGMISALELSSSEFDTCFDINGALVNGMIGIYDTIKDFSLEADITEWIRRLAENLHLVAKGIKNKKDTCLVAFKKAYEVMKKRIADSHSSSSSFFIRFIRRLTFTSNIAEIVKKAAKEDNWKRLGEVVAVSLNKIIFETEFEKV